MTPSALREGETLALAGTVTNPDDHVWREVQAYMVISPSPLTSRSELAAAAGSPPESFIGDRILDLESFDRLGSIEVGATAAFSLEVPWGRLPISGAEGVYTVGVQVLATDVDGTRDTVSALARARTFVALVDPTLVDATSRIDLGLLWPLRYPVLRRGDGTYARGEALRAAFDLGGRLRRMVDLASTAGDVPLSLVVDPALLDAADDLAAGQFGPPGQEPARPEGQGDGGDGGTEGAGDDESTADDRAALSPLPEARDWLQDVERLFDVSGWVTSYGEPDPVAVATDGVPRLLGAVGRAGPATAERLLGEQKPTLSVPDPEATGPETLGALKELASEQTAVLAPGRLPDWDPAQGVALEVPTAGGDLSVLVADPELAAGGPEPGDPDSALQMRQRLLAETALMALDNRSDGAGAVTSTLFVAPSAWDPGPSWPTSDFFAGLRTPWLSLVPVAALLGRATTYSGEVAAQPETDPTIDPLLAAQLVDMSAQLARRARVLARLIGGDSALVSWYDAAAALGVSSRSRHDGERRLAVTRRTAADVTEQLAQVSLDGPAFVTLASTRGRFGLTITNRLDRPVTVGVRVVTAARGLEFDAGRPVTVGPGERQTVTVDTKVGDNRVTRARAYLVAPGGKRFGKGLAISVRTSVVGVVVWVVVGIAALLLLLAIARRIAGRRGHRRRDDPVAHDTAAGA
jgi:hypothetical protein